MPLFSSFTDDYLNWSFMVKNDYTTEKIRKLFKEKVYNVIEELFDNYTLGQMDNFRGKKKTGA